VAGVGDDESEGDVGESSDDPPPHASVRITKATIPVCIPRNIAAPPFA
jgi:hypothetical protein